MRRLLAGACVALLTGSASTASAQTAIESNAGVQFDFVNPGARSLGLGGAFVALADDATAVFANPAGLRSISRREFSVEGRFWAYRTPYTAGGRLSGPTQSRGADLSSGLVSDTSSTSTASPAFVSFVYPQAKWAVAAYRQQLSNYSLDAQSQGVFFQRGISDFRILPFRATMDLKIARYGISGSYKVTDRVSAGAGVYIYDLSLTSDTKRFTVDPNRFYDVSTFSLVNSEQVQTGSDRRAGVTAGVMVTASNQVQIGLVYRQGAKLATTTTGTSSPAGFFTIPSTVGFGVSVHPVEPLKIVFDYVRVQYSQLLDNFTVAFGSAQPSDFAVRDANEVHAGAEYIFLTLPKPVAIRFGTWYDPDHSIRYSGPAADPFYVATFREGKDYVHGTFGAGVVLGQIEINTGVDLSSKTKTYSVSTVVRF